MSRPENFDLPAAYVVVAMDCSDRPAPFAKRRWPHWRAFCERWAAEQPIPLVFLGTVRPDWCDALPGVDLAGRTTPLEVARVIDGADAVVSVDGGLSHVAASRGVPLLVLYGPTTSLHNGPWGPSVTCLAADVRCRPCFKTPTWSSCTRAKCLEQLAPEAVYDALRGILERRGAPDDLLTAREQVHARWQASRLLEKARPAQNLEEFVGLWPHLRRLVPKRIVEIGSLRGGWCFVTAAAAHEQAHFVMVDPAPNKRREAVRAALAAEGKQTTWVQARSDDADAVERVQLALGGAPVDVLHIDGDHHYEAALNDWNRFAPLVRPGGLVVMHDVDPARDHPPLKDAPFRAVYTIREQDRRNPRVVRWNFLCSDRWRKDRTGIGIAEIGVPRRER